jgi:hypothetical protein
MTNTMSRFLRAKGTAIVNENTQVQPAEGEGDQNANVPNPINFIQVNLRNIMIIIKKYE